MQDALKPPLPPEYVAFLGEHNGGEGWFDDFYLSLYDVETLPRVQNPWRTEPNYLTVFASDGGGELFAFDASKGLAVVMIPGVGGPEHAIYCAPTFRDLLQRLHDGADPFAPDIAKPS